MKVCYLVSSRKFAGNPDLNIPIDPTAAAIFVYKVLKLAETLAAKLETGDWLDGYSRKNWEDVWRAVRALLHRDVWGGNVLSSWSDERWTAVSPRRLHFNYLPREADFERFERLRMQDRTLDGTKDHRTKKKIEDE